MRGARALNGEWRRSNLLHHIGDCFGRTITALAMTGTIAMPAIDLARLKKQTAQLADLFNQPSDFLRELKELLDFYVNRSLRSQGVAPSSVLPTYRTPSVVLRQIETELSPVAEKKPFSLQIKAVEETWVSLQVDDQSGKEMTFKPGEGISVQASNRIRIIIGNAGGLDLVLNGKPLEKLGKQGEVLTLLFTSQGVEVKRHKKPKPP